MRSQEDSEMVRKGEGTKTRRGKGGSRLNRSETVTIRLDPKLRYLTELAARKQRRTVSSFIEWAIENALHSIILREHEDYHTPDVNLGESAEELWDPDEPDRIAKLGLHYPELLNYDEQVLWKLVRETGYLWQGKYDSEGHWTWEINQGSLIFQRLRDFWSTLVEVAEGNADRTVLPEPPRRTPRTPSQNDMEMPLPEPPRRTPRTPTRDDMEMPLPDDDDIPF
jgi:hypothetical protein